MSQLKGIDISRWQGVINWDAVKGAKDFAIIKLGGSDQGLYPDGMAKRNTDEARRVGIPHGFYVFLGGTHSVGEEVQHIKNLVAMIDGLKPGEFIALDWERQNADEVAYIRGIAKALISAGFPNPPIYMSLSRVKGNDWSSVVALDCGLWVAAWGDNDDVPEANEVPGSDEWPFWMMWQYSSTGDCPGIGGRVDQDIFNGTVEQFNKYGAPGDFVQTPAPVQPSVPEQPAGEYEVKAGDNLSSIAARFGTTWQALYALNSDRITNPNRIYPGQKLRVPGKPAAAPKPRTYTVKSGDSLSSIAAKNGTTWQRLYELNRDVIGGNPNLIKPGQELKLP